MSGVAYGDGVNMFKPKGGDKKLKREAKQSENNSEKIRLLKQSMSDAFDPESPQSGKEALYYGVFFTVLGIAIAVYVYVPYRWKKARELARLDPAFLLTELNNAHRLTREETQLMLAISSENSLPNALTLFIEPKILLAALDRKSFKPSRPLIRELLNKLFEIEMAVGTATQTALDSATQIYHHPDSDSEATQTVNLAASLNADATQIFTRSSVK
ncbi:hypothetical protein FACS189454_00810 [Planctomycetales bacterium]|nr:hypothetical protein FACS189454_00810 [Planctomycetales bacterium]